MNNNLEHSEEFIQNKVGLENGFSTPKNYFDGLENQVFATLSSEIIPKEHNFNVPIGYFETLEDTILAKVSSQEKIVKVISLKERVLKLIPVAAAASVLLFIGLNSLVFNTTETTIFDELNDTDVEYWISNNIDLIADNDITQTYTDFDFDDEEIIPNSISNDELENYLSNQEDLSLILEDE